MKKSIPFAPLKAYITMVLGVFLWLSTSSKAYSQIDCNITMACNDSVQISLDENCQAVVVADMIMEAPAYGDDAYEITLTNANGDLIAKTDITGPIIVHPTVDVSHLGMTFNVSVGLIGCGTSCWGTATIEDKLAPEITNCSDDSLKVDCTQDLHPDSLLLDPRIAYAYPTFTDNCSGLKDTTYFDTHDKQPCGETYADIITRLWTVSDSVGNKAQCTQIIAVRRLQLVDVEFPADYDDIDEPAFLCSQIIDTLENGAPKPSVTGYPTGMQCHNIQMHYEDLKFDICGASKKYLRKWLVIDWCTGEQTVEYQTIKILDKEAPICHENGAIDSISTEKDLCTGIYQVPKPDVDDCSGWTYTVSYKVKDDSNDPYTNTITEHITGNSEDGYEISELPKDTVWVVYHITDDCGHRTECYRTVIVKDTEAPTPICEGFTVVGLEDKGWADLYAESIDDGSKDNCAIVKYEVRRATTTCDGFESDLQYGEKVNFCCSDVGQGYVIVYMRVYDAAGNFNDCKVNVKVEDKIKPVVVAPADIELNCTADYKNLDVTGHYTVFDNCDATVTVTDNESLNDCNIGTIRRTFVAVDAYNNKHSDTQIITLIDKTPFTYNDITWPSNREISCGDENASPEALNSFPTIRNKDCAKIAVSYSDQIFTVEEIYCQKIVRTWRVVNWCEGDAQNPTFYTHVQKIGIINNTKPTIKTQCVDKTITPDVGSCEATIDERIEAEDDCTPAALLRYSYTIDYNDNGTIDERKSGKRINGTYPTGTYRITWYVEDECDNVKECEYLITIKDTKAPTPICFGSVTWVLGENGTTEVWASDFNVKSEDGCGNADLIYSFNKEGTELAKSFSCADIPNGIAEEIPLKMYVIDAGGNYEYCDVILVLQDSRKTNACTDKPDTGGIIAGRVINKEEVGLNDIHIDLRNNTQEQDMMDMTVAGDYAFESVDYYDYYRVAPSKNDDVLNGVNTLDLVKIQRHILGIQELTDPHKLIAADINNDKKVSASDLLALRKVILGLTPEFANNTSWRFLPTKHEFVDPLDPFVFSEEIEIKEMYHTTKNADFYAIKVGDIDNTAETNGYKTNGNTTDINLIATVPSFETGDVFKVDFRAEDLESMVGTQLSIDFDNTSAQFTGIESGALEIREDYINVSNAKEGNVSLAWNSSNAKTLNSDDVLFSIVFEANITVDNPNTLLKLNTNVKAETYDADLATRPIQLRTVTTQTPKHDNLEFTVYQNVPNPFSNSTKITFYQAEPSNTTLTVYDITGKVITTQEAFYGIGRHDVTFSTENKDINGGVLYYRLQSGDHQVTRKMVVIK